MTPGEASGLAATGARPPLGLPNQALISRRSLLTQVGLVAAAGGAAWWLRDHVLWPAPVPVFADGKSSGWIEFAEPDAGVPIIVVRVNGAPVQALLDSGAQSSVIDKALAARLGLPTSLIAPLIIASGVSGAPQLGRTARMDVGLGGLTLRGLHAAVFPVAPVAEAAGRGFGLILGQDVLRRLVADLDLPNARLAFHAPETFTAPPDARAVAVRSTRRELFAPIMVEGVALEGLIDTGASATLALSAGTAEAARLFDGRRVFLAPSITFGGAARDRVLRVENASLLGRRFEDLIVHVYTPAAAAPLPSALVGVEALSPFRAFIDLGRGKLLLSASS